MEAADYEVLSVREQLFHERVRECIISTLLFATLYILCHIALTHFKKPAEFTTADDEDATVNKIALELCTFTLAVALGAVLLLPFSIISNEVLLSLPRNYYIQWLNGSLIHGLWNLVFLFSNLSLIFLMPFAYFFTESEGFAGSKKTSGSTTSPTSTPASPSSGSCCSWLLEDLEEQLHCSAFEEAALTRRICNPTSCWLPLDMELLHRQVLALQTQRVLLEKRRKASAWQRNLGYPLAMLCLLVLTGLSVLTVAIHILELLIDEAAMPRGMQGASLGQVSFSKLGSFGAVVQVVLIFYLMVSSVVGFYSSPLFWGLRPRWHDTAMTQIIGNCVCLLVLSSALPVFSRTLGLTRLDLLGDFGRFNWLGNFYIVFLYNAAFAGLTTLCLVKTFTAAVRAELIRAFDCRCRSPVSPGHLGRPSTSDLQLGVGGRKLDTAICCPGLEGCPGVGGPQDLESERVGGIGELSCLHCCII
ncbi:protein LMBR1L isoform X6 [Balaenoptera musculus]|uniref:Protein LMBR1L isoform X6 n=1 Tax=Balaenoptera musculus TaxID=9771 RepID=A0A8B8YGT7_BALMU|nr:protein LMBR1L isoform X6 [Balaenoptera musculus]